MPAPFAFRDWDYKGKTVRTVVDDVGGVHFVEGDIRLILESDDHFRKPSGLDRHETGPSSGRPRQQTLVGESRIKTLIRDSRGSEAVPLGEWVESVVIPALHGPNRQKKATGTRDPILAGLKALTVLRKSQVARDRHSTALEKAVDRGGRRHVRPHLACREAEH
jgi:prophage antirepressor-like protein